MHDKNSQPLYIFLDEAGNFDFSPTGTPYFILTSVSIERPFVHYAKLAELKYDLLEQGHHFEYFHASEQPSTIQNKIFELIVDHIAMFTTHTIIIEKSKTWPALRPEEKFYPKMLGYLLRYVIESNQTHMDRNIMIITDKIPVRRKQTSIEKGIKKVLADMLPDGIKYTILHHSSKSNFNLQVTDYISWAIYRKWSKDDLKAYRMIQASIKSEFEIFKDGKIKHY